MSSASIRWAATGACSGAARSSARSRATIRRTGRWATRWRCSKADGEFEVTTRPVCVHCDKPYGYREVTLENVRWPLGTECPAYKGNGIVLSEGPQYKTATRDAMRGLTMM